MTVAEITAPTSQQQVSREIVEEGVEVLTHGPKGSALVRLETLPDAQAVLLGRGFLSAYVEALVVEVGIFELRDVRGSAFELDVGEALILLWVSHVWIGQCRSADELAFLSGPSSYQRRVKDNEANDVGLGEDRRLIAAILSNPISCTVVPPHF